MNKTTKLKTSLALIFLMFAVSCSNLSLKKKVQTEAPVRLGLLGFKITAPIKKLKDIKTVEKDDKNELSVKEELKKREGDSKTYFVDYMKRYSAIQIIDIPMEEIRWKDDFKIKTEDLLALKEKYNLSSLLVGEIPWYGKTNIIYPIIGLTTDIVLESLVIGVLTKWNWPIILGNVGLELVTNTPLWFGGAYLFGKAFKPVTLDTKLYVFKNEIEEYEESFEVSKAHHMLSKYPKKDQKKIEYQLEASLRKALKEVAVELNK